MSRNAVQTLLLLACLLGAARPGAALVLEEFEAEFDRTIQSGGTAGTGDDSATLVDDAPDYSSDPFDATYPTLSCAACRDPMFYSVDFGNFAWNAVWGPERTIGVWDENAPGGMLRITNPQGQSVLVWFSDYIHMFGYPTNTMHINVRLPNGQVLTYAVLRVGTVLPVGETDYATPGDAGDGNEGADGEDDPDWHDDADDPHEYDEPDYPSGSVEILDPDDYGEYPDWFEEL